MGLAPPYILIADDDPDDLMIFGQAFAVAYPGIGIVALSDGDRSPSATIRDLSIPGHPKTGADYIRQSA